MKSLKIKLNLKTILEENFRPKYEEFEIRGLGFFKIEDSPEKQIFPINSRKEDWVIEVVFDDYKCLAGILIIPFKEGHKMVSIKGNESDHMSVAFMFSKIPVGAESKPIRWATEFYNQISQSQNISIEKFLRSNRDLMIEKCRQFREFQNIKKRSTT